MRINRFTSFMLVILLTLTLFVPGTPTAYGAEARTVNAEVTSVKGTVNVKRAASEKTFSAFTGLKLKQGDVVTTGKSGEVVVSIGDDKTIKALVDSSFKISSLSGTNDNSKAGFTLIKGTVFNEVKTKQSSTDSMTVQTGNTVVGVRGTVYSVNLRGQDGITVHVLEGSVFLDKIIERLEIENNASLIHEQIVAEAGEGVSGGTVYELSMKDLLPDELAYMVENPSLFDPEMVTEAQELLNKLPPSQDPGTTPGTEIVYAPIDTPSGGSSSGGSSGSGGGGPVTPPPSTTQYAVTLHNYDGNNNVDHYGTTLSAVMINHGANLAAASQVMAAIPVKLGYQFAGWDTVSPALSATYTSATAITGDLDLYPYFIPAPTMGTGTSTDPYIVTAQNFPHFRYFAHDLSYGLIANYTLSEDIDCNIYKSGGSLAGFWPWLWESIGTQSVPFIGSFDGGGKTISNFSITGLSGNDSAGLFGAIGGSGMIKDLYIEGTVSITGTSDVYAGLIAGNCTGSAIIQGCTIRSDSSVNAAAGSGKNAYAGLIAGICAGNTTIQDCQVMSGGPNSVSATGNGGQEAAAYAGGLAGMFTGAGVIQRCSVQDTNVYASPGTDIETAAYAGGITGYGSSANIKICSVDGGSIISDDATSVHAGGIIGYGSGVDVENCYVLDVTDISVRDARFAQVGGIAGVLWGNNVTTCYVREVDIKSSNISTGGDIGGIVGFFNSGSIRNCVVYSGEIDFTGVTAGAMDVGRICSDPIATPGGNNYANDVFIITPTPVGGIADDPTDYNGGDVTDDNTGLKSENWWMDANSTWGAGASPWADSTIWRWHASELHPVFQP